MTRDSAQRESEMIDRLAHTIANNAGLQWWLPLKYGDDQCAGEWRKMAYDTAFAVAEELGIE